MRESGFVLLHGAMLGGWILDRVVPLLHGPALPIDLPGRGRRPANVRRVTLREAIDSVVADVEAFPSESVTLVAHSISGILVPGLVSQLAGRVERVVYVGAAVGVAGEAYLDGLPTPERLFLRLILKI
jgi:pimeloyl-ACP methyl ester carboxylesterase